MIRQLNFQWRWLSQPLAWWLLALAMVAVSYTLAYVVAASPKFTLLFLAGLGGLLMLLIMIPNPGLGPYLVFGVMPISGWAFKQAPGSGFNFLLDALCLVAFASVMFNRKSVPFPQRLGLPIVFMLLLGVVQLFNPSSGALAMTIVYAIRDNLIPMLLFFVGLYAFRTEGQVRRFLLFLMLISAFNALYAMKQIFIGLDGGEAIYGSQEANPFFYSNGMLRAYGTHESPWTYGYDTVVSVTLAVALWFSTRSWAARSLLLVAAALTLAGLALTQVKTFYVVLPLGVLLMVLLRVRSSLRLSAILLLAAGGLALLLVMAAQSLPTGRPNPGELAQSLQELNILQEDSMRYRFRSWANNIIPVAMDYPMGKGQGTTNGVGKAFNPTGGVQTDSAYLAVAIEYGWVGLALYLYILLTAWLVGAHWHALTRDPSVAWIIAGIVAVVPITLVSNFTTMHATGNNGSAFYLLLGMMAFLAARQLSATSTGGNGEQR